MMCAQPNPTCVREVAFFLSTLTPEAAGDAIAKVMNAIRRDMSAQFGWRQDDAERFAIRFGEEVVAAIRNLPRDATVH